MNYLITGATGDVGSRVVEQLLHRRERPRIFVRDAEKARSRYRDRVEIFAGDLADPSTFRLAPFLRMALRRALRWRPPFAVR